MDAVQLKQQAADYAVEFVQSGMALGLGTGSTAIWAVRRIGQLLHSGRLQNIVGVPTSAGTEREARQLGIPLATLDEQPLIDLTIDGADEVDPNLDVIKGGGGALLREKLVAQASKREIIIVDESKLSPVLGTLFCVPVEVIPFGWRSQVRFIESLGARVVPRQRGSEIFVTDHGNYILDCHFGPIGDPVQLGRQLKERTGIVEHGIFIRLTTDVIVAGANGIRHLVR
jgi:ribose 5-phosphate isomerase A